MFGGITYKKSIALREEKRFCRSPRFSLDFPKKLSGIIHPDEFQQSIVNINRACRPSFREKILIASLFLCALIGLIVFIVGISIIWLSVLSLWIPLMSVGFVLLMSFFTIAIFVSSRVYRSCDTRLDRAVDAESRKYSTRSPVPTRWRLDMTIYTRRNSNGLPTDIQYFVSSIAFISRLSWTHMMSNLSLLIEIGQQSTFEDKEQAINESVNLSESSS